MTDDYKIEKQKPLCKVKTQKFLYKQSWTQKSDQSTELGGGLGGGAGGLSTYQCVVS